MLFGKLILKAFRGIARIVGLMQSGKGNHLCWRCELYQVANGTCSIIVNRGKKDRQTGMALLELVKVEPTDWCIWRCLPDQYVECADLSKKDDKDEPIPDDDDESNAPPVDNRPPG